MDSNFVEVQVQGQKVLIDKVDLAAFESKTWHLDRKGYVVTNVYKDGISWKKGMTTMRLHRMLLAPPKAQIIGHKNGNKLDNRRCNLRLATNQQNAANATKKALSKTGFKGVDFIPAFYRARIRVNGKLIRLGNFPTALDAAKAYNEAATLHFGEFASLNKV